MATINEITAGASYTGNAALGGALGVGVTISNDPFEKFAQFTYFQNKELWDQQNKKDKEAAEKIASITALDPNSPIKEQYNFLSEKKKEIIAFMNENPEALDYQSSAEKWTKLNGMLSEFSQYSQKAKANDVIYSARKRQAENENDGLVKKNYMDTLDADVQNMFKVGPQAALAQGTLLRDAPVFKIEDFALPQNISNTYKVAVVGANNNFEVNYKLLNVDNKRVVYDAYMTGLDVPENVIADLPPEEQDRIKKQLQVYKNSTVRQATEMTVENFNRVFKSSPDAAIVKEISTWAEDYNKQVDSANASITNLKKKGTLAPNVGLYEKINIQDGLSGTEYLLLKDVKGQKLLEEYTTDVTFTGAGNDMARLAESRRQFNVGRADAQPKSQDPNQYEPAAFTQNFYKRVFGYDVLKTGTNQQVVQKVPLSELSAEERLTLKIDYIDKQTGQQKTNAGFGKATHLKWNANGRFSVVDKKEAVIAGNLDYNSVLADRQTFNDNFSGDVSKTRSATGSYYNFGTMPNQPAGTTTEEDTKVIGGKTYYLPK